MAEKQCPICYAELVVREVTPCMDCGATLHEGEHLHEHSYAEYEVFPDLNLVLCNFCYVDFASYEPSFFGPKCKKSPDPSTMHFVGHVPETVVSQDKYCPLCARRLGFLRFLVTARDRHS